jgi:hypothetical protein
MSEHMDYSDEGMSSPSIKGNSDYEGGVVKIYTTEEIKAFEEERAK